MADDREESRAALLASAERGRELAALLDVDAQVAGVTSGTLRPELACIATPATVDDDNMAGEDYALTAGWGHFGSGKAVMPGQGRLVERLYTAAERESPGHAIDTLGESTFDVYLNGRAYCGTCRRRVWGYKLGGYQVLKKWLSYRERKVLGREHEAGGGRAFPRHGAADRGDPAADGVVVHNCKHAAN